MNPATERIRAEIAAQGAIPFARFMELALYCPDCGFYEKEKDTIGRRGNFYTSVSVGPLFGQLLAFQFAEWVEGLVTAPLQIVEAGAHDGRLAKDILDWLRLRRPGLFERIEYWIIEPSARRREWEQKTLEEFGCVNWVGAPGELRKVRGVIFSNELLDAVPVRRIGWDAKRRDWFEWGVTTKDDRFVWTRLPDMIQPSTVNLPASSELLAVLPDGFTTEICPAAEKWWQNAAELLMDGRLLTIDYGLSAEEFFAPQRAHGTLRGYHQHRLSDDVLADPGEQDLTAHVNFTAIQNAGEAAGLKTVALVSQAQFLTGIAQRAWQAGSDFGPWTGEHTRQFQTLTHPNHLGRSFRVLLQAR